MKVRNGFVSNSSSSSFVINSDDVAVYIVDFLRTRKEFVEIIDTLTDDELRDVQNNIAQIVERDVETSEY